MVSLDRLLFKYTADVPDQSIWERDLPNGTVGVTSPLHLRGIYGIDYPYVSQHSATGVPERYHRLPPHSCQYSTAALKMLAPYFLFFDVDADRELKIPVSAALPYMSLHEGRPARLRKCRVMVKAAGRPKWFLVITRYDADGEKNHAIEETTGFRWLGPLVIMKLERRGSRRQVGMTSSRDFHAAFSALERYALVCPFGSHGLLSICRYLEEMTRQLNRIGTAEWRLCIIEPEDDATCSVPSRVVGDTPGEPRD